jgi:hypothetical protein
VRGRDRVEGKEAREGEGRVGMRERRKRDERLVSLVMKCQ